MPGPRSERSSPASVPTRIRGSSRATRRSPSGTRCWRRATCSTASNPWPAVRTPRSETESEGRAMPIRYVITTLKPGVKREDYERWLREYDYVVADGVRAAAQHKKALVVAWDSDIDSLDPAVFKSQGAYVTVANTTDAPLMWKVRPIDGKPGLFRSMPGEWDGHLAESWTMEDNGATIVLKVRRGMKFPSGRPITAPAFKYSFDRGLLSPGYLKTIFPTLTQVP